MEEYTVALAGNPNVGKSSLFNRLTGLHQHTGNWPGKTVELARGTCRDKSATLHLVDLPGTYSLQADSPEEQVAGDFIAGGEADVTLVVADATSLRRSLHLAVQVRQMTSRMVLCVNLIDEARRRKIEVDFKRLSCALGVPAVAVSARSGEGLDMLCAALRDVASRPAAPDRWHVTYGPAVERELAVLSPLPRHEAVRQLARQGNERLRDGIVAAQMERAEAIAAVSVRRPDGGTDCRDRWLDRLLTSRRTGIPAMLLLLLLVFYLTIWGANYPSALLSRWLMGLQEPLRGLLGGAPWWLRGALVDGMYRTVAWVVSVMLPPMAVFFPLFTALEDAGLLPRIAFDLDRFFRGAGAHGRQSLTMCMGFGCNACGVTGCRIIDSPRERLVAMLTNQFVPCNGRFPTLIALIRLFFSGGAHTRTRALSATGVFLAVILFSVAMTWLASRLLSSTVLRGETSSFSLELPPYRMPRLGQVLVRSLLDRTLFVLGRALTVAAPAGLLIWILANVRAGGAPLLTHLSGVLEPLGRLMGLDGMILLAFLLGFPANEIVLPVLLMGYLQTGSLTDYGELTQLGAILTGHGWTAVTALCAMLLCLLHFPCGTTCLTLRRETGSWKWTVVGFLLPTAMGVAACMLTHGAAHLLGM
ncbi:MAG: ferrous iron transport protein B [Ruminococcaceae bacterium]|nr:ferrous iron transport protein B [Oscillospiraceae bacterium]